MAYRQSIDPVFNFSTFFLLATNLVTIWIAVDQGWKIGTVLVVYWGQIVSIGFFNVLRIRAMRKKMKQLLINKVQVKDTTQTVGRFAALFFILHFGAFAAMYMLFIAIFFKADWKEGIIASSLFFLNHGVSYFINRERDLSHISSAVRLLVFPYLRIIPMHIIVSGAAVFSWLGMPAVIIFLLIKTVVDVMMHVIEHTFTNFTVNTSR